MHLSSANGSPSLAQKEGRKTRLRPEDDDASCPFGVRLRLTVLTNTAFLRPFAEAATVPLRWNSTRPPRGCVVDVVGVGVVIARFHPRELSAEAVRIVPKENSRNTRLGPEGGAGLQLNPVCGFGRNTEIRERQYDAEQPLFNDSLPDGGGGRRVVTARRPSKESDKAASGRPRLADTRWKLSLLQPPDSRTSSCSSPSRLPCSLDRLFGSRFQAADAEPANDYPGAVSAFSSSCCSTNPSSVESVSAISLSPHLSRRPPTFPAAESLNSLCLQHRADSLFRLHAFAHAASGCTTPPKSHKSHGRRTTGH
ncbi:hypothetical protein CCHR01_00961 [Colletotrichum chrysophilum]|uniref:Uncharacterized protein n=1 Tax=Colletotrichum chrysophilum TaxID=1836956 RepID=A0AAD9B121_9PEZI|nr:hypothetical protein CCHR01_00961 [Colletotrichum chrysophilum]